MNYRVRLTNVQGDQEEYADLIGAEGKLMRLAEGPCFMPEGRGDWLTMPARRVSDDGEKVVVSSKLGNKFTFRILPQKAKSGVVAGS